MSSAKPLATYAISHGFSHGRRHSGNMRRLLSKAGYQEVKDVARADIILAHSAGCYRIPLDNQARLILLVGVPMNTQKLRTTMQLARKNDTIAFKATGQYKRRLRLSSLSVLQLATHPRRHYGLVQTVKANRHALPHYKADQTIVIASRDDPWPEPVRELAKTSAHGYSFISLTGSHNHIWQAPEQYVEIIEHYAK
jgi:predicted alpha/beta hydrolase family esterase